MSLLSSAIDALSRFARLAYAFGVELLRLAYFCLTNENIMMIVLYISGVTIVLLAVMHASSSWRGQRAIAKQETVPDLRTESGEGGASHSHASTTEAEPTERDSSIDRHFREIQDELAVLKSKLKTFDFGDGAQETRRVDTRDIASGHATAALRKELEVLLAEISGDL